MEVHILFAGGLHVEKLLWVILIIGKSDIMFSELIVVHCLGIDENRYVNVELIFGKTDVMRWLFSCQDVENDE